MCASVHDWNRIELVVCKGVEAAGMSFSKCATWVDTVRRLTRDSLPYGL